MAADACTRSHAGARLAAEAFTAMAEDRDIELDDDQLLEVAVACMGMLDTIRDAIGGKDGQHHPPGN